MKLQNYHNRILFLQNSRHKTYGFDILTEDEKVFYPLAADSEAELEEWTAILTRAIASEMDDTDGEGTLVGGGGEEGEGCCT